MSRERERDRDRDDDRYDQGSMMDDGRDDDRGGRGGYGKYRRKVCRPSTDPEFAIDYKNVDVLKSFLTEHGKIVPRRMSGNCAFIQRRLTVAIKRARQLGLIGYVNKGE